MAIQDKERNEIIAMIQSQSPAIQNMCSKAFLLGHEEGWWLARTDPESGVSPVEHAANVNPFKGVPDTKPCTCGARKTREPCTCPHLQPEGHIVVSIAYTNEADTWLAASKSVPLGDKEVPVEFRIPAGSTLHAYTIRAYARKTDAKPVHEQVEKVPATLFNSAGTYTVWLTPQLVTS